MTKCTCKKCKSESSHASSGGSTFLHGAVIGALAGVALGVLYLTPQGEENRKKLKKATNKTIEKSKEVADIVNEKVIPKIEEISPLITRVERDIAEAVNTEGTVANKVTHLADLSMDNIKTRMKKNNKNASKRNFFKGNF